MATDLQEKARMAREMLSTGDQAGLEDMMDEINRRVTELEAAS